MTINSEWQTKELATAYLEGVRGAIPGADLQLVTIEKIVRLWCDRPCEIMDLGCGDGILGRYLLNIFPAARCTFVDFSEPMLEALNEKVSSQPNVRVVKGDFSSPLWVDGVSQSAPFDIVISGFSIHHQPNERKQQLYGEIYRLLRQGGVFLNLEHVASLTTAGERLFDEFFLDHLHHFHRRSAPDTTRESVAATYYNRADKKENILTPVEDQCRWLREIGFQDGDCFFKIFELALFGGRTSANPLSAK